MSGIPVVVVEKGGVPVRAVDERAPLMTIAGNGSGTPITLTDRGVPFIVQDQGAPEPSEGVAAFVGHSLVSPSMSPMYAQIAGVQTAYQVINGAPLAANWEHHLTAEGQSVRNLVGTGIVDVLVLAEGGPIEGSIQHNGTREQLAMWRAAGVTANADMRTFWYQIWPFIPDYDTAPDWPAWVAEIDRLAVEAYGVVAEQVAADIAPAKVHISPVGEAFAALWREFDANGLPDVTSFQSSFFPEDDIHVQGLGFYFACMVHYATIERQSPVGRPWQISPAVSGLTAALALKMQEIAWTVVSEHPYAGVAEWGAGGSTGQIGVSAPADARALWESATPLPVVSTIDVGSAGPGRAAIVIVSKWALDTEFTITIAPGTAHETALLEVASVGETDRVAHIFAGVLPAAAAGELSVSVASASGGFKYTFVETACFVVTGGDIDNIRAFSGTSTTPTIMASAGEAVIATALLWNPNTQQIVLTPPIPEIQTERFGTDPAHRVAWGVLETPVNSTFAIEGSGTERVGIIIPPVS